MSALTDHQATTVLNAYDDFITKNFILNSGKNDAASQGAQAAYANIRRTVRAYYNAAMVDGDMTPAEAVQEVAFRLTATITSEGTDFLRGGNKATQDCRRRLTELVNQFSA